MECPNAGQLVMTRKVCFFIQNFGGGGAQLQLIHLVNELQKDPNFEIWVAYLELGPRFESLDTSRVHLLDYTGGGRRGYLAIFKLFRDLKIHKIDTLMTWLVGPDVIGFIATRLNRTKWVLAERNSVFRNNFRNLIRKVAGRWADLVIANSDAGANYWKSAWPKLSVLQISNIVSLSQFEATNANTINVITVGRLTYQKDSVRMARVLANMASADSDFKALMLGEGELEAEVQAALAQTPQVELPGYVPNAESLIANAKILLHLSRYEGQPNVVLEAVVVNTIPVVSDIGEHLEVLGPEYPFYVSPTATDAEIAQMIQHAQTAPLECLDFAKAKIAEQTVEKITAKYKAAILNI